MNSFRPISNLTFLSKTVERAVAIRFFEHSELHKLLPHHQSAYRSSHSSETAVLAVHNDLVRTIDSGNISALVLLDLSAAFNTVDHSIMLQVLRDRFCVEGRALKWFESYLYVIECKPTRSKINNLDIAKSTVVSHRDRYWVHTNFSLIPKIWHNSLMNIVWTITCICRRHSDDWTDDNSWHSRHYNETSKLHRSNTGMVQIAMTSTESGKDRTDLVWVKG